MEEEKYKVVIDKIYSVEDIVAATQSVDKGFKIGNVLISAKNNPEDSIGEKI